MPDTAHHLLQLTPRDLAQAAPLVSHQYQGYTLSSHFQPVYSVAHRHIIGYEGLVRAQSPTGSSLSPAALFALPQSSKETLSLDRLCRTLHAQNFATQSVESEWLFVNLNAQTLISEKPETGFTRQLLNSAGLSPHRLVVEILENEVDDPSCLKHFIDHLHELNCLIAIDDFGAGHSNFDRIWQLQPDIVKLDRNLIHEAVRSKRAERVLSGIISLLHQTGSLVVVEGVETEEEAKTAIAANADMMQGYFLAHPAPFLLTEPSTSKVIDRLLLSQNSRRFLQLKQQADQLYHLKTLFERALKDFVAHSNLHQSSTQIFCDPCAVRCYLLDEQGFQSHSSLNAFRHKPRNELRFAPLLCGDKGNWSHRPYHYLAIERPGVTITSEPYLSIADSRMCITLSQAFKVDGQLKVYCCDIDWQDERDHSPRQ